MNTTKAPTAPTKADQVNIDKLVKEFGAAEDPIASFFKANQKSLTYILLAVVVSALSFNFYQSAHQRGQLESAGQFSVVRSNYEVLAGQAEGKSLELAQLEKAKLSFEGSLKTLEAQKYPYDLLGKNYQVLAEVASGNLPVTDLRKKLEELEWTKSKNSPTALWKELLAVNLAKALLTDETQQDYALTQLKSLAQESEFVRVLSLLAWRSYAETKQDSIELAAVASAISSFTSANPEQTDLLK